MKFFVLASGMFCHHALTMECSNMAAEFRALLNGLQLARDHGLFVYGLSIECDSLVLVNSVLGKCDCAWPFLDIRDQIRYLMDVVECLLVHVFREVNSIADSLANHAVRFRNSVAFSDFLELPCNVKLAVSQYIRGFPVLLKEEVHCF
ncbi:unnamed protein product [Ilex paraguariensis]|uniref:RNase H type-1 domain-containing protein n=1 Tax=Ilex paraguariensis TaxID=185542 RepID=A0ABC8TTN3_9AQUA